MNSLRPFNSSVTTNTLSSVIKTINGIVSVGLGIITAGVVILAVFIAFKFFTAADEGARKNAKAQLIYAVIGVIVLVALTILAPQITGWIGGALK